jgi:hypoxanthine phosphoribosyltransferase
VDAENFLVGVLSSLVATLIVAFYLRYVPRGRRMPFRLIMRDLDRLVKRMKADSTFHPEAVVAISRSGAIVGGVLTGLLDGLTIQAPLVFAIELKRGIDGVRTTVITSGPSNLSEFKRIVLVTCTNDTGEALRAASEWIARNAPSVEVRTAALYSRRNAVVHPDFVGRDTGKKGRYDTAKLLVGMPWMNENWTHDLPRERNGGDTRHT